MQKEANYEREGKIRLTVKRVGISEVRQRRFKKEQKRRGGGGGGGGGGEARY